MMGMFWVVLFVALTGSHLGYGSPVRPTPQTYPHDEQTAFGGWGSESGLYAVPALALVLTAVGLLFGCTWCYRHKDCKPNEGADNQLFTAMASHLHSAPRVPPDSGFSEPANNNVSEYNNNGPISLREMQNIANNNAAAYIVSENEERNRVSRESVVEFEPLPTGIRVADPLEHCADWFGGDDFSRNHLQYLREIGRGWFGRVVEGELEDAGASSTVAVKILNQNASLEDKARFLDEARMYRDVRHENILAFITKCLQEDPWILIFELCSMDLQQYLIENRPKMAILNESGVPLRLMCDVTSALSYLHSRGYLYGNLWSGSVLVRGAAESGRAVLGRYSAAEAQHDCTAPEIRRHGAVYTGSSEVWSLGALVWQVCAWGAAPAAAAHAHAPPDLPCPYRNHLHQVMQLCWNPNPEARPTSAQVHALINHLYTTHTDASETARDDGYGSSDFEERWQRLKPNTIPKIDEHVAIIHAPSTSMTSHFTGSDQEIDNIQSENTLSVDMDTAVSRSSSIMSDKDPLSVQIKSESLTNLHGSLEDVRNIYLTHNEMAVLECHQGNISLDDGRDRDHDRSDSSVDPWLKDIIAGSQDDVSYYKDVSDVIKNLDNILNSEKTSSSESSHQASPSRDNLSLDCKKDYPMQSSMVKSPGIVNFQNVLDAGFDSKSEENEPCDDDDRDTIGTLSHSFERHSDTNSQHTLENLTPDTPMKDVDVFKVENEVETAKDLERDDMVADKEKDKSAQDTELPNEYKIVNSDRKIPKLMELCTASMPSVSGTNNEQLNVRKDCQTSCDNNLKQLRTDSKEETKSIDDVGKSNTNSAHFEDVKETVSLKRHIETEPKIIENIILPKTVNLTLSSNDGIDILPTIDDISNIVQKNETFEINQKTSCEDLKTPVSTEINSKDKISATDLVGSVNEKKTITETNKQVTKSQDPDRNPTIKNMSDIIQENDIFEPTQEACVENFKTPVSIESKISKNENLVADVFNTVNEFCKEPVREVCNPTADGQVKLAINYVESIIEDASNTVQEVDTLKLNEKTYDVEDLKTPTSIERNNTTDKTVSVNFLVDNVADFSKEPVREVCNQTDVDPTTKNVSNRVQEFVSFEVHGKTNVDLKLPVPTEDNETVLVSELLDSATDFSKQPVKELCNQDAYSRVKLGLDDIEPTVKDVSHTVLEVETHVEDIKTPVSAESNQSTDEIVLVTGLAATAASFCNEPVTIDDVKSTIEVLSNTVQEDDTFKLQLKTNFEDEKNPVSPESKDEKVLGSDLVDIATNLATELVQEISKHVAENNVKLKIDDDKNVLPAPEHTPEPVQNLIGNENCEVIEADESRAVILDVENDASTPVLPPDVVQIIDKEKAACETEENLDNRHFDEEVNATHRSDNYLVIELNEQSNDNTVYMDLMSSTNSEILKDSTIDNNIKEAINSCLEASPSAHSYSIINNESTEYLDLPSFVMIKETGSFLDMERRISSNHVGVNICASTPIGSNSSAETVDNTLENSIKENNETQFLSETKVPDHGPGISFTKLEQKCVPDSLSPFESPTKSHPTDTYDENSSVVLGPFENCTIELYKGVKSNAELVELPKEELLAFSSNFSEMNLETPSPLRDVNFLNEVPDIAQDDLHFDYIETVIEPNTNQCEPQTENNTDSGQAATEIRLSPSTPPNSPGIFLASTSQEKYLIDTDLNTHTAPEPDSNHSSLQNEIDLNQIELQITSKLAMAENENNLNIEYSGPLTVEGLVSEDSVYLRESDPVPESYLAGNGGSVEDVRGDLTLDEECVKALRNELELKLPLAQVAAIEPQCESSWSSELPPPPELVVSYPGALSPIAEETGQQLSAYENDINWNTSVRTDSSESYPEPCNNSTDEVTDLPTGAHTGPHDPSTYTILSREHSQNNTYTLQKDIQSSRELTMSADSLNASPYKIQKDDTESPIDDKTYNKNDDDKESNCERLSQVSPFLVSPTTDTSAPDNSDNFDNATGVSTLSKTTLPTDAKLSKPSDTQCLSKATSIDSWCSNDTLYNVEENFDDLAVDSDVPLEFEPAKVEGNSDSTDTLTHADDEKELSHCSTYIVHDSKSEACDTYSPDSITANDHNTYTKVKTKSDVNDSTKNTQTKDLAYGTLMSGLPSYSNCTTEIASGFDDAWKLAQPEMVRRSPMRDDINVTPPEIVEKKDTENTPRKISSEPCIRKMDSVEISCLQDNLVDSHGRLETLENEGHLVDINDSPNSHFKNLAMSLTSTPITELGVDNENTEAIPMQLPQITTESQEYVVNSPNFRTFQRSVEERPQDFSSIASNEGTTSHEILLDGESKTLSRNSNRDSLIMSERSLIISERSPTYSEFENSASTKMQEGNSKERSSQSMESGINSEEFRNFESSVRNCPQDLSSIDASNLLLKSERISSELEMGNSTNMDQDTTSQSGSRLITNEPMQSLDLSPPNVTNLIESHDIVNNRELTNTFLINFDMDDEMEQPHSIIITEAPLDAFSQSPNRSYDSHTETKPIDLNHTYDSHTKSHPVLQNHIESNNQVNVNGEMANKKDSDEAVEQKSPTANATEHKRNEIEERQPNIVNTSTGNARVSPKESVPNHVLAKETEDFQCNGNSANYATVNFLNETFEELLESNVDDNDCKDVKLNDDVETTTQPPPEVKESIDSPIEGNVLEVPEDSVAKSLKEELEDGEVKANGMTEAEEKMASVTDDFLQNEKKFCQLNSYIPMLSDIRFTGPASEIMSTSFTQDSPTEAVSTKCEQESKPDTVADILKEWDSDSESHTSNSSSGEFIWKDGDGHETAVVPSTHFDHQRGSGPPTGGAEGGSGGGASEGSGDSGSGSEGDEVEFVPSSWDCRAAPSKSSLRSLEQAPLDSKKRVVFKRQKYHCVYEYPREAADLDAHSPAYLPDLSTYSEWDPRSAEEAELCYGALFAPALAHPLRAPLAPLASLASLADYDEDFFISSSARPFESLGIMSTTSQFFPGMHVKPMLERDLSDDVTEEFPPPPSPLPTTTLVQSRTPSLDFTTPDSGVEDITPGSTTDDDFKAKKLPETELAWRPLDSGSSSESVSPSSPGGEALGGLRHTRDKLKLDLPPSPHIPSPRHNRVFNFVLDKPKRRPDDRSAEITTPLVMTDETPIVTSTLPLHKDEDIPAPEPTFSTFGKCLQKIEPEQKIILTDDVEQVGEEKVESPKVVEAVKGEGTVLDSGDEDSGIESSSKATLERNKAPNVS